MPCAEANAGDAFAGNAGGMKRNAAAIADDGVAAFGETAGFDLQTVER